jgi:hypothetical protein
LGLKPLRQDINDELHRNCVRRAVLDPKFYNQF